MSNPEFNCEFLVQILGLKPLVHYLAFATRTDFANELSSVAFLFYSILSRQPLQYVMRNVSQITLQLYS